MGGREREAGASLWKTLFGICGEDQAKTLWLENKEGGLTSVNRGVLVCL